MNKNFKFYDIFYLDVRSIAIFRVLIGIILIYDLIDRSGFLLLLYSDLGVLPLDFLKANVWNPGYFSIHASSGTWEWQLALFILHGLFAFSLLIGYKSKLSLFVCWLLLISLHNRNPLVLNSGDTYLRLLLFWSLFMPIGVRYSIDALKKSYSHIPTKYFNIGTVGFIIQILLIYFMGVLFKSSSEWLSEGTALYYALNLDQIVKPFGSWLLNFHEMLKYLTFGTLAIEFLAPLLLISPLKTNVCRVIGITLLISLHLGIFLTLHVGIFVFICIAALITLLPTEFLDKIGFLSKERLLAQKKINLSQLNSIDFLKIKYLEFVGIFFLIYTLIWNINTLPKTPEIFNDSLKVPAYTLRTDQRWSMFAPNVFKSDGWYIFEATLSDGRKMELFHQVDLLNPNDQFVKPKYVFKHFKNARWRKYLENVQKKSKQEYYAFISDGLLNLWNRNKDYEINCIKIYFIHEPSLPIGYPSIVNQHLLYKKRIL
jgi:hypothetical protein